MCAMEAGMATRIRVLNRRRRRNQRGNFHYCGFEYKPVAAYEGDPHYSLTRKGCNREGMACYLPMWGYGSEHPSGYFCWEHREIEGFCVCCGTFSAGFESFGFGPYRGYCDDCARVAEAEDRMWEDGYDDDGYSNYDEYDEYASL
jgi:hypothetical protein